MCQKCGCNTCESIRGPLLTEGKVKVKSLLSENLQYHLDKNIPLFESVFRIGSDAHLNLIREARKMYSRDIIDLCKEDEHLIKTHLGEFGLFEGEAVPLDLPMLNEQMDVYDDVANMEFGMDYDQLGSNEKEWVRDEIDNMKMRESLNEKLTIAGKEVEKIDKKGNDPENWTVIYKDGSKEPYLKTLKETPEERLNVLKDILRALEDMKKGDTSREQDLEDLDVSIDSLSSAITGKSALGIDIDQNLFGRLADPKKKIKIKEILKQALTEAKKKKKKKKDPPIGKPKRGGPKAYYVYVRDPKTKKIKKVTFGSGGLKAKIRNPKARKAFAARHRCKTANDRTTARYWSCRLPRYASLLGLGANMNTFW
jgi:hypothetical protein